MRALRIAAVAVLVVLGFSSTAIAAPFVFTYTTTVLLAEIPGTAIGDTVVVQVVADNGSATTISQDWFFADLLYATATVGSYSATYVDDWFFSVDPVFQTDATGALTTAWFTGSLTNSGNSDNFGTGGPIRLFANAVNDFNDRNTFWTPGMTMDLDRWSAPVSAEVVPEPATLTLLGLGLAGAAVRRFRPR